jgi:DNA-binding NarL/FixJ family response regulator
MRFAGRPATIVGWACQFLIVDDHEEFRRSARALLEADGYTVVGEARDGATKPGRSARSTAT